MNNQIDLDFPKTGINKYVRRHIQSLPDLSGKTVLDIPCGDGRASLEFNKKGCNIIALDLFPEFFKLEKNSAQYADLLESLPLEDNLVDYIVCQEGIEHIPNQLKVLEEFNRVLKKGGVLLITTPNNSHLRAKLSYLLLENDLWKKMPPTEIDGIWFSKKETDKIYFGHLFLLSVQHLQTLLRLSGFKTKKRVITDISSTSLLLLIFLYPLIVVISFLAYFSYTKKNTHIKIGIRKKILWERLKLNLSLKTLLCKHIFWEVRKTEDLIEVLKELKNLQKN